MDNVQAPQVRGTLPVRAILNSNPSQIREDLGDLEPLKKSLQDHNMKLPILLTQDWELVDGARRLHAAKELGWEFVPVLIDPSWDKVIDHYKQARRLGSLATNAALPMTWLEFCEVWGGPLHRMYGPERTRRMLETKKRKQAGEPAPDASNSGFNTDLAAMFEFKPAEIKCLRDVAAALGRVYNIRPAHKGRELGHRMKKLIDQFNAFSIEHSGNPFAADGIGRLRRVAHHVARGDLTVDGAEESLKQYYAWAQHRAASNQNPTVDQRRDRLKRRITTDTKTAVGRLVDMVQTVSFEANHFEVDSTLDPAAAATYADALAQSVLRINRLKRELLKCSQNPTN